MRKRRRLYISRGATAVNRLRRRMWPAWLGAASLLSTAGELGNSFFSWGLRLCQLWLALALLLGSYLPGSYSSSLSRPWIITDAKAWASRAVCNESLSFNIFYISVHEAFNVDLPCRSSAQKVNVEGQRKRPTLRGADVARGRARRYLQQDFSC